MPSSHRVVCAALVLVWIALASAALEGGLSTEGAPHGTILLRNAIVDSNTGSEKLLQLPNGSTTRALIAGQPEWVQTAVQSADGVQQYLVVVDDPSEDLVFSLNSLMFGDGEVVSYIPEGSYLVAATPDGIDRIRSAPGVQWVGPYKPEYKLAPEIFQTPESRIVTNAVEMTEGSAVTQRYMISLVTLPSFTAEDADRLASQWRLELSSRSIDVVFEGGSANRIVAFITDEDSHTVLSYLAQQPQVHWVEMFPPETVENQWAAAVVQSASTLTTKIWERGIRGEGEVIAVTDTGVDYDGCFFHDPAAPAPTSTVSSRHRKIVAYNPRVDYGDYAAGHGTHVAGTLAGEALSSNANSQAYAQKFNGVAYKAKLAVFDAGSSGSLSIPSDMTNNMFPWCYNAGARIHSNSWGGAGNTYTSRAQDLDTYTWRQKDYLVLKSAGNDGPGTGTLSTPGSAKNALVVGATSNAAEAWRFYCCSAGSYSCCTNPSYDCTSGCSAVPRGSGTDFNTIAGFSSRGPCSDGRIAPHVTAPGMKVFSAYSDANLNSFQCGQSVGVTIISKQGTSMSTPVVAASAALVRQYFREGWYPTGVKTAANSLLPSAALLRAAILNSGQSMRNIGTPPDNTQGFGIVNLENVLKFADSPFNLFVADSDSLSVRQSKTYCFNVKSSDTPFKTTLSWTDPPSTLSASVNIINNLDLSVTSAMGNTFNGNAALTGGAPDRLNTVEQVVLTRPSTGLTKITVTGTAVPQGPQPFALVATGAFDYLPTCTIDTTPVPPSPGTTPPPTPGLPCCGPPHVQRACRC